MSKEAPVWSKAVRAPPRRTLMLGLAALLFAELFIVRLVWGGAGDPILLFAMFPIALVAIELGMVAAIAAGGVALGLFAAYVQIKHPVPEPGVTAYVTRATAFLVFAVGVGIAVERVRAAGRRIEAIIETSHEAFVSMAQDGTIMGWNRSAERIFGWPREEIVGRRVGETIVPSRLRAAHVRGLAHFLDTGEGPMLGRQLELRAMHRDGHEFPVELTISTVREGTGFTFHAFMRDITERKEAERERDRLLARMEVISRTDEMTGLPNRRGFDEELRRELARSGRSGEPVCVAVLDLDHFKAYNDENGHLAGNALLEETATAWRVTLRAADLLARFGGDEFAAILPTTLDHALAAAVRLQEVTPRGQTLSVGVALWDGSESAMKLFFRADAALYEAKRSGRNLVISAQRRRARFPRTGAAASGQARTRR